MRPPILAAAALAVLSAHCAAATDAPVTAVVLYPGSAGITRTAQVAPGATEVVLTGLPANFDVQTMRVQASSGLRVGEVTTLDASSSKAINPAEVALVEKIEALQDQGALLDAESASAEVVKKYLERLNAGPGEGKTGQADAKALSAVIDTIGRGASDALVKIQKLAVKKRENTRQLEALERDLARIRSGTSDKRAVTVKLFGDKGGVVTVSYQLSNAGWKPSYRASLDSSASTVELARMATVAQNTGEDWSNVKLTLSTSQPRQSPVGREAQPWLLSWHAPQSMPSAAYAMAPPPAPAPVMARSAMAPKGALERNDIDPSLVSEVQGTYASEFEVPGRVSLPSDGRSVSLALSTQVLAARQQLRVTPRLEQFATVMAETARPAGIWPQGRMQLFRDGGYVGAMQWNLQEKKKAEFAFGRDELVSATVAAVDGKSGSKGIFGARATSGSADVITLVNRHKQAVDVQVIEASPVSTSDEVKVQATFSPKPDTTAWDERRGVVAWQTTLAGGASAVFNVDYKIDYPKEGSMVGLR